MWSLRLARVPSPPPDRRRQRFWATGIGAHLGAAAGETNFVGGFGAQYLFGGQGANILTYLSIGDGGDRIAAFDPAKDVIDLSRIDADITKAGVQNFTFIGSAAFSAKGAEVRYQLNPANNTTLVQADLVGDSSADFTITLQGQVPLTAANFALTASQSSADLADGSSVNLQQDQDRCRRADRIRLFERSRPGLHVVPIVLRLRLRTLRRMISNMSSSANELVLYDPS